MAVLGLRFCARAFSSCGKRGPLFIVVHGPRTIAASLFVEHRLQTRRLSNCGSRAQLLRGMWDLPRPGLEPVSPALAGRFSTTVPPGKPHHFFFVVKTFKICSLSNFQIYGTVLLTIITLYIRSLELTHVITGILYTLNNISPFPPSQPLVITTLLSGSLSSIFLDSTCK